MPAKQSTYYTYIVECADGTLYTGVALDVQKRIKQHNGELTGGAKYTSPRRPVILKYLEEHCDRAAATQREYQLKQLTRHEKQKLIGKIN
jgi:putative endonuclease